MTVKFKGIDLEIDLARIIPHVSAADSYGGALQNLQSVWDSLTLLGQLSGGGTDMSEPRRAFGELAVSLVNQLGREALKKSLQEMGSKAQVAVNILVRNLFERTADIGFLASDENIRAFLRDPQDGTDRATVLAALRNRFGAYIRKYSVYFDIVVLDRDGNILARFDDAAPNAASADPLIRAAIETTAGYVETFRESDLIADRKRSLIYSFRVTDRGGAVLGVLCLCFRFDHEAELIFSNLIGSDDWTVVTILDQDGIVIASSDPFHVPVGAKLSPVLDAEYRIVRFGPAEYLATSRAAQPYQGYGGPGWYGHVMVPIQHVFNGDASHMLDSIEPGVLDGIIHTSKLFTDEIRTIPSKAEHIQRELNRSVWSGNVARGASSEAGTATFSKVLLKEISGVGAKTKDVFEGAIADLHETVVASLLHDNQCHAALAIDIMDRNLYERANDCRWWALTSAFSDLLSRAQLADQDVEAIDAILRTINTLYTVYSNLIIFDRGGKIVAAANSTGRDPAIGTLAEEWVARILSLKNEQDYAVSSFVPGPLHPDGPTYIYGAAIRAPQQGQVVGGIAVVFDSGPQFAAMLTDALPRDGAGAIKQGAFALFVEPDGRIIACSDDHFRPGDTLAIDATFLRVAPVAGHSGVAVLDGTYYAVGAKASTGYREYKSASDLYRNDVIALVLAPLCKVGRQVSKAPIRNVTIRSDRMRAGAKVDVATFFVGGRIFAARASEIVEAVDFAGLVPLPFMPDGMTGCLMYLGSPMPVFDLLSVLEPSADGALLERPPAQVVIMTTSGGARFGFMVDGLGEITEILEDRLTFLPRMVASEDMFADVVLAPSGPDDGDLIVVLRADRLYEDLSARIGRLADAKAA
ncbi:MAG TPA: chemotaxis protein CheW [Xanthobacteraceae bacterium]|nr:chemotaxis protein CheW [Xanthobacteraceae bacterium]